MTENLSKTDASALRVVTMRKHGMSAEQIARMLGVHRQYVYHLEDRGLRVEADIRTGNPAAQLSERTRNALTTVLGNDPTPAAVAMYFKVAGLKVLKRVPNIGVKCIDEIQAWLKRHGQVPIT